MTGIGNMPFLLSDGMSCFCDITLLHWNNQSEISNISLLMCKSLPKIWGTILHGWQNLHPELRQVFPRSELFPPDLGHINELPKWLALNPGHDFARSAKPSRIFRHVKPAPLPRPSLLGRGRRYTTGACVRPGGRR